MSVMDYEESKWTGFFIGMIIGSGLTLFMVFVPHGFF